MMTEPTRDHAARLEAIESAAAQLSNEENAAGHRLVRTCDAFALLRWALEETTARGEIPNTDDLENARAELRVHEESAEMALSRFKRRHGIPD